MTRKEHAAEPAAADLAAIEAEWPLIEAELAVLDAEIATLTATGGPSPLEWRRLRRAQRQLLAALASCRTVRHSDPREEARRAWMLAGRDTELEAWNRLYDALYPRPASTDAPGQVA